MPYNLVAISGSLRKDSHNTALVHAFKKQAPEGVSVEILDISQVPMYNQDLETEFPQVITDLKEKIQNADGIIVATPEYNRSFPGVLKNVIDWTSRPYGQNAWKSKPVYVVGATISPGGTMLAQAALKQSLLYLNTIVLGQPEFYLAIANDKIEADGTVKDPTTKDFIDAGIAAFTQFIDKVR